MANIDVDGLSFEELAEIQKKAGERMKGMEKQRIKDLRKRIKDLIKEEGFTPLQIVGVNTFKAGEEESDESNKPKRVAKKQYKDPKTGSVYKGFGPRPAWLKDKNGKTIEKYLITD
jgi:DNA-binding protein H-NS